MEERDKGKALRSGQLIRVPHIKVTAQAAVTQSWKRSYFLSNVTVRSHIGNKDKNIAFMKKAEIMLKKYR